MESPDNPFRQIKGANGICAQTHSIIAYTLTESAPWSLWSGEHELVNIAKNLMGLKLWTPIMGVDAEAFVCLCLDLWEEAHK